MKGFLKMHAVGFDTWNATATTKYIQKTGDASCDKYTTYMNDINEDFVWARVEDTFIEGDIKTNDEAVALGMLLPDYAPYE